LNTFRKIRASTTTTTTTIARIAKKVSHKQGSAEKQFFKLRKIVFSTLLS